MELSVISTMTRGCGKEHEMKIKSSATLLDDLLRLMSSVYVGQVFSMDRFEMVRQYVRDIAEAAQDEGQAMCAPLMCGNANTSLCPQCEDGFAVEDYDYMRCQKCHLEGGFTI